MEQPPELPDLSLLRRIGGGSYGDVWLARTITGVYRAVKVVNKARFADERPFLRELDGITRFQRSVGDQPRQLALMHVARLEAQGIFYYVMELADDVEAGTEIDPERYEALTLKALHERRPVLPAAEVIRIGSELARSLQGLHAAGLIHRDVKPSNIIFVAGVPKLADIGLVSSSDHTLTSLGTPGYSPPEGAGTLRADIYSLGKILYQLATGLKTDEFPRLPAEVHQREDVRALLELNEVFLKACQPNPQDRYASAQEMLDDLMLLHAGRSVRELQAVRARLRTLGRAALWLGAAAAVVIAVLGVRNYFAVRALAATEQRARLRAEEDERLARYTSDLSLAQLAIARGDLGLGRSSLRRQVPGPGEIDLRGPEWFALWNESSGDPAKVLGTVGDPALRRMALRAADGAILATVDTGDGEQLVAYDMISGAPRVVADGVRGLGGFTADGRSVVVGGPDRAVRTMDPSTGVVLTETPDVGSVLYGGPGGGVVVVADRQTHGYRFRIWDVNAARDVAVFASDDDPRNLRPQRSAVTRNGLLFAVGTLWAEGSQTRFELAVREAPGGRVRWRVARDTPTFALAFSPDEGRLAVGGSNGPVLVHDVVSGALVATLPGVASEIRSLAFSPDGSRLAAAGTDQTVRIWRLSDGVQERVLRGHEAAVIQVVWEAAEGRLLSGGMDGTVRWWSLGETKPAALATGLWSSLYGDFLFLANPALVAATDSDGAVVFLDARTLTPVSRHTDMFQPLGFDAAGMGMLALTRDLRLVRFDLQSGQLEDTSFSVRGEGLSFDPQVSADGGVVFIGSADGGAAFWDLASGVITPTATTHPRKAYAAAFAADSRRAVSGGEDGIVRLWSAIHGQLVREFDLKMGTVTALVFEAAGDRLWVGFESGELVVLDTASGEIVQRRRSHTSSVHALARSPDGARIASAGRDGVVVFWRTDDVRALAALPLVDRDDPKTRGEVWKLRYSADGSSLGAFAADGALRVWRVR